MEFTPVVVVLNWAMLADIRPAGSSDDGVVAEVKSHVICASKPLVRAVERKKRPRRRERFIM